MKLVTITPLPELKQFYTEEIAKYTTIPAKKACLSRLRKQVVAWQCDLQESLDKAQGGLGWLHGERVHKGHLTHVKNEIAIIDTLRSSLVA